MIIQIVRNGWRNRYISRGIYAVKDVLLGISSVFPLMWQTLFPSLAGPGAGACYIIRKNQNDRERIMR